jgi:signal transduction histidine kinase/ligand-binding sensor domain-containing protein/DNA-binding response OmpR family regulator
MTYLTKLAITVATLIVGTLLTHGQSTRFFDRSVMSSSQFNSIAQDRRGYLWIGTDYGLMRFDGNTFKTWLHSDNSTNCIVDNRILDVVIDPDDALMLATANGLQRYNPATGEFKLIPLPDKDFNGYISDICTLSDGGMLCVASGVGVYRYDSKAQTLSAMAAAKKLRWHLQINRIVECTPGSYIFSSQQGEVAVLDRSGQITERRLCTAPIVSMVKDKYGDVIIVSADNVWRYDVSRKDFTQLSYEGEAKHIYKAACSTKLGITYITTSGGGIKQLLGGDKVITDCRKWSNPTFNLATARLNVICEDKDSNLWIGCTNKGMLKAANRPNKFRFTNLTDILSVNAGYIQDVVYDKQGYIWCSIDGMGAYKFTKSGEMALHVDTKWQLNRLHTDEDGRLIAGINNKGIYSIDTQAGSLTPIYEIDGASYITALTTDEVGNIYAALDGRALLIVNKSGSAKELYSNDYEDMINNWMPTLVADKSHRLWIGHYSGFSCYNLNKQKFSKVKLDDELRQGVCNDILAVSATQIWMATNNGLLRYDAVRNTLERYLYNGGVGDNSFLAITRDRKGNIWATTRNGINKFDTSTLKFTAFYGGNGLDDNLYNRIAVNDAGTSITVAGQNGITTFDPEKITATKLDAAPVITDLTVKGVSIDQSPDNRREFVVVDGNVMRINLDYTDNAVALTLSTLDFRDSKSVSYQYKLSKSADDWINTGVGDNIININNLTPGSYRMQIRACENDVYSPITEVEIHVAAPWFATGWAKIIYLLIILTICRQVYVTMQRRRDSQINEAKLQFFINISHEIRSPMTLILSPLEALMKEDFDPKTKQRLNTIHRNATRILDLINQLLDIRKIDKGKMEIHCSETELVGFVNEFTEMFRPKAESKQISLTFESNVEKVDAWIDRHNFDKVLVNLLTNAFKYTPNGGNIRIELSQGSDAKTKGALRQYAMIRVIDSGIGIDEKKTERIFDRFYQDNAKRQAGESAGFGIGLNLCRLLMQLHHGSIRAYNRTDGEKGACFEVKIPLGDAHLTRQEKQDSPEQEQRDLVSRAANTANDAEPTKRVRHRNNHRVLIVDDDSEICSYLKEFFSEYYKVETLSDGASAWQYILEKGADLVISDINMPGLNGFQLLKNIKSNSNTNHIPVVLLTSLTEYSDRKEAWAKGADAYLAKPFNGEELLAIADSLIDNRIVLKGHFSGAQSVENKIDKIEIKSNDDVLMNKIIEMINQHIDDAALNVEMIGQEVGISRAHLHRKMKEMVGLSPSDFVRTIRLRKACEILRSTDNDVTQVAYSVGFTSQTHFSTAFKKFTGMSPSEYRSKQSVTRDSHDYLTESSKDEEGHS